MRPRPIVAIARKEFTELLTDRAALTALAAPLLVSVFFLVFGTLIGGHATNLLVYNPGQSPLQQLVSGAFSPFKVVQAASSDVVAAAFGPDGSHKSATYEVGLIIPANFEASLQAGDHPQVTLFLDGNAISVQQRAALQFTILNYARGVATPQPPANLVTATINPSAAPDLARVLSTFYGVMAVLLSLSVGVSLMPTRLIEEKEKQTLRAILVAPASFGDVVVGKLLPILVYQVLLSTVVVFIVEGGAPTNLPLVLVYILLASALALAVGLLIGSVFPTSSAAGAVGGFITLALVVPGLFAGPLAQLLGGANPATQVSRFVPTYYVADGLLNAFQHKGSFTSNLLDMGLILGSTTILLLVAGWLLRRQTTVVGAN